MSFSKVMGKPGKNNKKNLGNFPSSDLGSLILIFSKNRWPPPKKRRFPGGLNPTGNSLPSVEGFFGRSVNRVEKNNKSGPG